MKLNEFFDVSGQPFIYYPGFVHRFNISVNACVFLCFIGWKTLPDSDGWREHNTDGIETATGLSVKEQSTARKQLAAAGLLEERYARLEHVLKFKIVGRDFDEESPNLENGQTPKGSLGKRQEGVWTKEGNKEVNKEKNSANADQVEKQTPSEHAAFIKQWSDEYKRVHCYDYVFNGGRDGKAVKRLVKDGLGTTALIVTAVAAWSRLKSPFLKQRASTIHGFADALNEIRCELRDQDNASRPHYAV